MNTYPISDSPLERSARASFAPLQKSEITILKVDTHQATSCSSKQRRQITPCVQVRRLFAATCCGDTSQRQIASFLCNRILSPPQVAQILSDLIFCNVSLRQNSVAETKIFTKILHYTRSDLSQRRVIATCGCNLSPSVYRP